MLTTRAHLADLEIRGGDGRTVHGLAVPFDSPTQISEGGRTFTEVFRRGAFTRTIAERGPQHVKFLTLHDRAKLPIGRAETLVEDTRGLVGSFRVSKTVPGDEALELIRDGALDALSIGFRPIRDRWSADRATVERVEAALPEVSAVPWAAYPGALIEAVRSDTRCLPVAAARQRLALLTRKA